MKTLQFWMIALAVITLSACGGKEKITKENGVDILNEVLGYPYGLTTQEDYSLSAGSDAGDYLYEQGMIRRGTVAHTRSDRGFSYFTDYDSLISYAPANMLIAQCNFRRQKLAWICCSFLLARISIDEITNISQESEDGKVTVQFTVKEDKSNFYNAYATSSRNYSNIAHVLYENTTGSATIQRTDDGWMLLEQTGLKQKLEDKEFYSFRAHSANYFGDFKGLLIEN